MLLPFFLVFVFGNICCPILISAEVGKVENESGNSSDSTRGNLGEVEFGCVGEENGGGDRFALDRKAVNRSQPLNWKRRSRSERPGEATSSCWKCVGLTSEHVSSNFFYRWHVHHPPLGLQLGQDMPSGQPVFVGPTASPIKSGSLELGFSRSNPPSLLAPAPSLGLLLLGGIALRIRVDLNVVMEVHILDDNAIDKQTICNCHFTLQMSTD
ncbi:hypothetical protein L3X38_003285 [Prunus dulcis]|uniref:Uncharacterized protein n=1 Tax=Prunus dulcis TaxID=3755 RepID=A0AAD4ZLS9_PRUDU|nr:hypothetical protein L3X38_003285 [Prunus dulcis]